MGTTAESVVAAWAAAERAASVRTHSAAVAGTVEGAVAARASFDAPLGRLRVAAVDRPRRIPALDTSVASNSTVPALDAAPALEPSVSTRIPFDRTSSDATSVTGSDAGGAVAVAAAEVTTIPTVVHPDVLSVRGVEVLAVAVIVAVSAYSVPGVGSMIGMVEMRTSEVEVVTVRVTGIDAEVPVAGVPVQRTIEIGCCDEGIPLPVEQDIAQVEIAALPVGSVHIVTAGDTHQVVEIDLIGCLVLLVSEIQLISHLVGQEQGFFASLLIAHCVCRDGCCQHHHQCEKHLLHNCIILIVQHSF